MAKFKVGDRVQVRGNVATAIVREYKPHMYLSYLVEFESDVGFGHDGNGVAERKLDTKRGWWCGENELTKLQGGYATAIRTVTRREIVPGTYGIVQIDDLDGLAVHLNAGMPKADDLREAAHLFNQLAEVLEENAKAAA